MTASKTKAEVFGKNQLGHDRGTRAMSWPLTLLVSVICSFSFAATAEAASVRDDFDAISYSGNNGTYDLDDGNQGGSEIIDISAYIAPGTQIRFRGTNRPDDPSGMDQCRGFIHFDNIQIQYLAGVGTYYWQDDSGTSIAGSRLAQPFQAVSSSSICSISTTQNVARTDINAIEVWGVMFSVKMP